MIASGNYLVFKVCADNVGVQLLKKMSCYLVPTDSMSRRTATMILPGGLSKVKV